MELTKEQIKFIDHRLDNEGIKYWDIRIEMLDHVVLDVESILKPENSAYEFKEIVQQSFEKLGWKENFNGGGFDTVYLEKLKYFNGILILLLKIELTGSLLICFGVPPKLLAL